MHIEYLAIKGLAVVTPKAFEDERGYFSEIFNEREFQKLGFSPGSFVQDNYSRSSGCVIRGLHYQLAPAAQGKLVRCVRGAIFDVAVDLRKTSATFGQWAAVELSEENRKWFWIPVGFAHGFLTLTDLTDVLYKTTDFYSKEHERSIHWSDKNLSIDWPQGYKALTSAKDELAPGFEQAEFF